jgi:hypothetical protein
MKPTTLRAAHALSATALSAFAFSHIANHLAALGGVAAHTAFLDAARRVYRQPAIELLLLACVAFQIATGLALFLRGRAARSSATGFEARVARLQALSGTYLAAFLALHVGAVLTGRIALHLDTDFNFAAAGFHVMPFPFFFIPYYFLAVLAFFAHLACAGYWHAESSPPGLRLFALAAPIAFGAIAATLIPLCLGGILIPVQVPPEYLAPYRALLP